MDNLPFYVLSRLTLLFVAGVVIREVLIVSGILWILKDLYKFGQFCVSPNDLIRMGVVINFVWFR